MADKDIPSLLLPPKRRLALSVTILIAIAWIGFGHPKPLSGPGTVVLVLDAIWAVMMFVQAFRETRHE